MSSEKPDDKEVGYRKPPVHTRFKPGQSGNPRGRSKGRLNFATDLKRTLETSITLTDQGKPKKVTTQAAILLRLREKALKGDARALDRLLEYARLLNIGSAPEPSGVVSAEDETILAAYLEQVRSEERAKNPTGSSDNASGIGE